MNSKCHCGRGRGVLGTLTCPVLKLLWRICMCPRVRNLTPMGLQIKSKCYCGRVGGGHSTFLVL